MRKVSQWASQSSARGCALANAAVELAERRHPARRVVEAHKRKQCERLAGLVREAGSARPARLAAGRFLLGGGAPVNPHSPGRGGPSAPLYAPPCWLLASSHKREPPTPLGSPP